MSLKYAVLGFLQSEARHGYEIKQSFEKKFGNVWSVSYGQLYPTLKKLARDGLIAKRTETGQKTLDKNVYSITKSGQNELRVWLSELPKKVRFSAKDEFSLHFLMSLDNEGREDTVRHIEIQKSHYAAEYQRLEKRYQTMENVSFQKKCLVRKQMLHVQAELLWLNELVGTLTQ